MAIEVISTIKPKNNGNFPIVEAEDVSVDKNGTRLSAKLEELASGGGSGGGADNGFNVANIVENTETGVLTLEFVHGNLENALSNPASLVLAMYDTIFFTFKRKISDDNGLYIVCETDNNFEGNVVQATCTINILDGTVTLTEGISSGSSGLSGSSRTFIDVSALPTENINENAFYRVSSVELYLGTISVSTLLAGQSATVTYYVVETLPAEGQVLSNTHMPIYVLASTGITYITADGTNWITFGQANGGLTDVGWTDASAEKTSGNLYTVATGAKIYSCKYGVWNEYADTNAVKQSVQFKVLSTYTMDGTYTFSDDRLTITAPCTAVNKGSPNGYKENYYKMPDGRLMTRTVGGGFKYSGDITVIPSDTAIKIVFSSARDESFDPSKVVNEFSTIEEGYLTVTV